MRTIDLCREARQIIRELPNHECAYCASEDTIVKEIVADSERRFTVKILCKRCNKEDHPWIVDKDLRKIARCF